MLARETRPPDPCLKGIIPEKQPGHWLLASVGKRVLRPGGLELTRRMLNALAPGSTDDVVEFAPGLGITARMVLDKNPRSYVAIERDVAAAQRLQASLCVPGVSCIQGNAEATGLPEGSASVVYGEAMLTMQSRAQKLRILREAHRVLRSEGRYAIHEMCLLPDEIESGRRKEIERELSRDIHVGVQPLTVSEWKGLLRTSGFEVIWESHAPMHLLEPGRMVQDEGFFGVLRIAINLLLKRVARQRVLSMRRMFHRFHANLGAVSFVCIKMELCNETAETSLASGSE